MLAQHLANQLLVVTRAVDVGRIEEIESDLDRALERRGGFSVVARAVELRHPHASEAQFRHHEPLAPEFSLFHKPHSPEAFCAVLDRMVIFGTERSKQHMRSRQRMKPALRRVLN